MLSLRSPIEIAVCLVLCLALPACHSDAPGYSRTGPDPEAATHYADLLSSNGGLQWPDVTILDGYKLDQDQAFQAANRDAHERLRTLVSLNKDEIDLEQVINFLRDATGANIAVNWLALELIGIDQDSLVTINQARIPAHLFLKMALDLATPEIYDPYSGPSFKIQEGIVIVSTKRDLKADAETRVYDIRWLLIKPRLHASLYRNHPRGRELIALLEQDDWWTTYKAPGVGQREEAKETDPDAPSGPEPIDITVDLIQSSVGDIDEWLDEESTLTELNGNLVIRTTPENHRAIRALLLSLEKSQNDYFKARAKAVEVFLLLEDAEASRLNQDYNAALAKINQALRVDPHSLEATALKAIVTETLSR